MKLEYKCANDKCRMTLEQPKAVDMIQYPPKVDDIMLCGACGTPSVVTLTGTRLITDEEFRALDDDTRRDLDFAQRAIKRHVRNN